MKPLPKIHYSHDNKHPVCRAPTRWAHSKNPFKCTSDTYYVTCLKCEGVISTVEKETGPMKSYIPTKAQITAGNKFHSYMQGWRDGACARAYRHEPGQGKTEKLVEIYMLGYSEGKLAAGKVATKMAKNYDYEPSILRIGPKGGPQ